MVVLAGRARLARGRMSAMWREPVRARKRRQEYKAGISSTRRSMVPRLVRSRITGIRGLGCKVARFSRMNR